MPSGEFGRCRIRGAWAAGEGVDFDRVDAIGGQREIEQQRIGRFEFIVAHCIGVIVGDEISGSVIKSQDRVDVTIGAARGVAAQRRDMSSIVMISPRRPVKE